jgi:fido (protein-threonine AMPylation protein)
MGQTGAQLLSEYQCFVAVAIEGKYEGFSDTDRHSAVGEAMALCDTAETLTDLFGNSRQIASPRDDVINQVVVLNAISRFSEDSLMKKTPLETLHRLAYGTPISEMVRSTRFVEGYPDPIPTELSQTNARFSELQGLVVNLSGMPSPSVPVAAHLMAHVFSAVIRIHYFSDGNGRVARFAAQYLSSAWGFGFFNIPKVHNDLLWKSALRNAITGDIKDLAAQISKRLAQKEGST